MRRPNLNRAREKRITDEIIVDAYGPEERAMGWYYYLEEKLEFPFRARCVDVRSVSPLKKGEEVEVVGMTPGDDCMKEMFVIVGFAGRRLGVPLAQLDPVKSDKATREAVADWRYWVAMGHEF
ncbi:MAG: calcium-binding protein [Betaproteobacteria bacterium]|nr:calcium-binding protein [Betaproteobacteria bacterium]